jgi:NAD(P)-dependent dehydrogenase (short-subunit alcohol dehydrogenase family)
MTTALLAQGAKVYVSSRKADVCSSVAAKLNKTYGEGKCIAIPADLSKLANITALVAEVSRLESRVDILVNNSGVSWGEDIEAFQEKGWDKVMDLNVKTVFFLVQAFMPLLTAQASLDSPSRVVNIGSTAGIRPQLTPTYSYDVSKAAVHYLTQKLAADLADRHITVNAIAPGYFPSRMSGQLLTYASEDDIVAGIPIGRAGRPEDLAATLLWMVGRGGSFVTGIVAAVDGGVSVRTRPAAL